MSEMGAPFPGVIRDTIIALILAVILPFLIAYFFLVPVGFVLTLVTVTLFLEYAAVFIGTAMGMDDAIIFFIVTLVAAGIIYFQLSLFDHLGKTSPRIARFLERTRGKYGSSTLVKKYGIFALVPGILVLGFYICPAVAWLLGWDRKHSLLLMLVTYCAAAALLLPVSSVVIQWLSGFFG
jgi:hypothetical protein